MGAALFGIIVTGLLLAAVWMIVNATGTGWIDALMPPVVTGAIVALIGFNLGGVATSNYQKSPWIATLTLATIVVIACDHSWSCRPTVDLDPGGCGLHRGCRRWVGRLQRGEQG